MTAANPSRDSHAFSGAAARGRSREPTLEDILAGPIVRALMLADHVDAEALTAMLRSVASRNAQADPLSERAFGASRREPIRPISAEVAV